jgi:RsiW-degrading membrane proteinase PrsW (M82 family)
LADNVDVQPYSPQGAASPPGWRPDPWDPTRWRWWDGWNWTLHVGVRPKKPVLPIWLSLPVLIAALPIVPGLLFMLVSIPQAVLLAMAPMLIVLPVMMWLDGVEPEPKGALVHAFLWGATISVLVASIVNATVAATGGQTLAVVVSAPLVEEAMKAGGILYAVRRKDVDGPVDGIVYAGWTAVGFAVVEDVEYFATAAASGNLAVVFVLRGLLAPFAHPLFTAWTGLAIGRAVARGKPLFPAALWGYALAVASHALWNGSAVAAETLGDFGVSLLLRTVAVFVLLFFTFAIVLYRTRRKEEARFAQLVPWLAGRYGVSAHEIAWFGDFRAMRMLRKRLHSQHRRWFDRMHAALARLAALHDRPGGADPGTEQALVDQLHRARSGAEE